MAKRDKSGGTVTLKTMASAPKSGAKRVGSGMAMSIKRISEPYIPNPKLKMSKTLSKPKAKGSGNEPLKPWKFD